MQLQVGDIVRFLNTTGGGRVVKIKDNLAYVDDDGFETPVLVKECVVVRPAAQAQADTRPRPEAPAVAPAPAPSAKQAPAPAAPAEEVLPPVQETARGEKLNLMLAFEPADIKHLSSTTFDAFVVNDSNYYLYFTVATRGEEADAWTVRYAGLIEPAMQIFLFELSTADLPAIDRISFQAVAFKRDRDFTAKPPVDFSRRFDATKFARVHCFAPNVYFDTPVLAYEIVKDDETCGAAKPAVDAAALEKAMNAKARADRRTSRPVSRDTDRAGKGLLEVDLHATELLDSTAGMSASEILNYQIDTFRRVMDENLRFTGRKIVFIHGNGEGVLRAALLKELKHRYKGHEVSDASFAEYGFGATMVTIRRVQK